MHEHATTVGCKVKPADLCAVRYIWRLGLSR